MHTLYTHTQMIVCVFIHKKRQFLLSDKLIRKLSGLKQLPIYIIYDCILVICAGFRWTFIVSAGLAANSTVLVSRELARYWLGCTHPTHVGSPPLRGLFRARGSMQGLFNTKFKFEQPCFSHHCLSGKSISQFKFKEL